MGESTTQPIAVESEYASEVALHSKSDVSDYGSDFDLDDIDDNDTTLADVLDAIKDARPADKHTVLPSIEFEEGEFEDEEYVDHDVQTHRHKLRVAKGPREGVIRSSPLQGGQVLEVEYDERSRRAWSVPLDEKLLLASSSPHAGKDVRHKANTSDSKHGVPSYSIERVNVTEKKTRSPLERFRTKPKKPLSVTDLVSPAWCELQYLYTLSKFGRKPRTQAMRIGSEIHQKLEDQVHTTVPVQVHSKEDKFGLRIWNTISGLQCLRETGLTRELEIWGILDGQVVNGVIDDLSYTCPDPALEDQIEQARVERDGSTISLPPGQLNISQAFAQVPSLSNCFANSNGSESSHQVYLADVKTRSVPSVPRGISLRPTWMQLMLYRKLLESLSLNTVDAETLFARYDVQPLEPFTNAFMQDIGLIGPYNEALNYPNLLSLWSLLVTELHTTLPPTSLSPILRAEFRYAKTGDVIGSELMVYDETIIDKFITEEMAWWRGLREAKGVEVEEAFKCRICNFADDCTWRNTKIEEATEKNRLRRQAREKSSV